MNEDEKKEETRPEDPYPDLATALHGEFILFRNELVAPPKSKKDKPDTINDKAAKPPEESKH